VWSVFKLAVRGAIRRTKPEALRVGLLLWAALFVASCLVPHAPVLAGPSFDIRDGIRWEYAQAKQVARGDANPDPDIAAARVRGLQPALLQAAVARLAPQTKGRTDLYTIGMAGWSDQDVFLKEVDGALAALEQSLPIGVGRCG
jgi:hypothetical protein